MKTKELMFILALLSVIVGLVSFGANPSDGVPDHSEEGTWDGECGESMHWELTCHYSPIESAGGTYEYYLQVTGDGVMENYTSTERPSWEEFIPLSSTSSIRSVYWGTSDDGSGLSNRMVSIGDYAFYNTPITEFCLYGSAGEILLERIGDYAFANSGVVRFVSSEKDNGVVTMPHLTYIGDHAFEGSGLKDLDLVTLAPNLTYLGAYAFGGCTDLSAIEIPESVEYIGQNAFQGCSNLRTVTVNSPNTVIESSAFSGCSDVKVVLQGFTKVPDNVLSGIQEIAAVEIGDGAVSIGDSAFSGCVNVRSVSIPDSVRSIGGSAFMGCPITSVNIPGDIEYIGSHAFDGCDLQSPSRLDFGRNLTEIGDYAFRGSTGLRSIDIKDTVQSIGEGAFAGCPNIEYIRMPFSISLESSNGITMFSDLGSLKSIEFTTGQGTGNDYDQGIAGMWSTLPEQGAALELGEGIGYIGNYAFCGFKGITDLVIPDYTEAVGEHAFDGCDIHSVTLGLSLGTIGDHAFDGNENLNKVVNRAYLLTDSMAPGSDAHGGVAMNATEVVNSVFMGYDGDYQIAVDEVSGESLLIAYNGEIEPSMTMPSSFTVVDAADPGRSFTTSETKIASSFLEGTGDAPATAIESVVLGENIKAIGNNAFVNLPSLKEAWIECPGAFVGAYCFTGCEPDRIFLAEGMTICDTAFSDPYCITADGVRLFGSELSGHVWTDINGIRSLGSLNSFSEDIQDFAAIAMAATALIVLAVIAEFVVVVVRNR